MYLDTLIQPRIPGPAQAGVLDSSTHILPSGLNPSQSVLNVVPVPSRGAAGLLTSGSMSLSTPVLSSTEITRPISNLLFKASPHGLSLSDQPMLLQSTGATPLVSQLGSPVTSIANSICVLPSQQSFSVAVNQQGDTEGTTVHLHQAFARAPTAESGSSTTVTFAPATPLSPTKGRVVGVFTQTQSSLNSQSKRTTPIHRTSDQSLQNSTGVASATITISRAEKGKPKAKRSRKSTDLSNGKKVRVSQTEEPPNNPVGQNPSKSR